ncbi:hypothetical protein OAA99_03015 [Omnitrophica bacterium]|nr:hypothetical protein [Candidatus Omnitrophota bacterium]
MGEYVVYAVEASKAIKGFIEFCTSVKQAKETLTKKTVKADKEDTSILKQQVILLEKRADLQDRIIDHLSKNVLPSLERVIKAHDAAIDEMGSLAITNERMVIRLWKKIFPQSKIKKIARTERRPMQLVAGLKIPAIGKKKQ